jgi:hypothetical protein
MHQFPEEGTSVLIRESALMPSKAPLQAGAEGAADDRKRRKGVWGESVNRRIGAVNAESGGRIASRKELEVGDRGRSFGHCRGEPTRQRETAAEPGAIPPLAKNQRPKEMGVRGQRGRERTWGPIPSQLHPPEGIRRLWLMYIKRRAAPQGFPGSMPSGKTPEGEAGFSCPEGRAYGAELCSSVRLAGCS